jgi:hypothetical protein
MTKLCTRGEAPEDTDKGYNVYLTAVEEEGVFVG